MFIAVQSATAEKAYALRTNQAEAVYRLYNKWSTEHLYTESKYEYDKLVKKGWKGEGIAWYAPLEGDTVYRLYNEWSGDHHYTTSRKEYEDCQKAGWKGENTAFYSGGNQPIYRLFNKYVKSFYHHYPASVAERDKCVKAGWKDEGTGWYGYSADPQSEANKANMKDLASLWSDTLRNADALKMHVDAMVASASSADAFSWLSAVNSDRTSLGFLIREVRDTIERVPTIDIVFNPSFETAFNAWYDSASKLGTLLNQSKTADQLWNNRTAIASAMADEYAKVQACDSVMTSCTQKHRASK